MKLSGIKSSTDNFFALMENTLSPNSSASRGPRLAARYTASATDWALEFDASAAAALTRATSVESSAVVDAATALTSAATSAPVESVSAAFA